MAMRRRGLCFMVCAVLSLLSNLATNAVTLSDLVQTDKLVVHVFVEPVENIVTRQQVMLLIEISTDTRFSGGTKIGVFEVEDAIVMQREKFALNSIRKVNGIDWIVQLWSLVVYPQRSGVFEIPEIPLRLSIAGNDMQPIVGEFKTQPLLFVAGSVSGAGESWIATTRLDVNQSFDRSFEGLKPGDAIVRTINMSADDLPAMMLPDVVMYEMDGLAVYSKPSRLTDKVNRGVYLAERTQVLTYVFEKPGDYALPKQSFYWWNLESRTVEVVELESQLLKVRGAAEVGEVDVPISSRNGLSDIAVLMTVLALIVGVGVLVAVGNMLLHNLPAFFYPSDRIENRQVSEKDIRRQFVAACRSHDLSVAIGLLYRWLDYHGGTEFEGSLRSRLHKADRPYLLEEFDLIMRTVYANEECGEVDLALFGARFMRECAKPNRWFEFSKFKVGLKLN